jgi:hypothetical protein
MTSFPLIQSSLSPTQTAFIRLVAERKGATGRGEYVYERQHVIAFLALTRDGRWMEVCSVRHSLKQIEATQGSHRLTESTFEIHGFAVPEGRFPWVAVERIVQEYLDALQAVRLLPAGSGRAAA